MHLTLAKIVEVYRRNHQDDSNEDLIATLPKKRVLRLDHMRITIIDNLDVFSTVIELYLQNNLISKIENLEPCMNLKLLVLANNQIRKVENLSCLKQLHILDISKNLIQDITDDEASKELPLSLRILNMDHNPCCDHGHNINMFMNKLCDIRKNIKVSARCSEPQEQKKRKGKTRTPSSYTLQEYLDGASWTQSQELLNEELLEKYSSAIDECSETLTTYMQNKLLRMQESSRTRSKEYGSNRDEEFEQEAHSANDLAQEGYQKRYTNDTAVPMKTKAEAMLNKLRKSNDELRARYGKRDAE